MKSLRYILLAALPAVLTLSSCIRNDMSYPRTRANITVFNVEGQVSSTVDANKRTVSIELNENADITALVVDSTAMSEGSTCDYFPVKGDVIDLSSPLTYTLSVYYSYQWTVSATQTVDRYVVCENQIGNPYFNVADRDVTVYVSDTQDLSAVTFTDMKLEPDGSVITSTTGQTRDDSGAWVTETVPFSLPITLDCLLQRTFNVEYDGETIVWTMSVIPVEVSMAVTEVNAWTYHADVEATYSGSGTPYFSYRKSGNSTWTDFTDVSFDGVNVTATIPNSNTINSSAERLSSGTTYEIKLCDGNRESDAVTFTTETPDQLKNMDFDDWYYDGKVWYPCAEEDFGTKIWDSANKGVASFLSTNPTTPESDFVATPDSKYAAKLTNTYALIKFAAGNIITGEFIGVENLGAVLTWGTPFTHRPRAVHGYYSYSPGYLTYRENKKLTDSDELDRGQMLFMLTDWDEPFEVNTNLNQFVDQQNDEHIIAYFRRDFDDDSNGVYEEFTYELDYRRPTAIPKYAVIIFCASQGGDEFTGSTDSVMYVDQLEYIYD